LGGYGGNGVSTYGSSIGQKPKEKREARSSSGVELTPKRKRSIQGGGKKNTAV